MLKRIIITFLIVFVFGLTFSTNVFANEVDIILTNYSLEDDSEKGIVYIFVYSYEEPIIGVDMNIVFSDNVVVEDVLNGGYCDMGFNSSISNSELSLECFNDLDVKMDGILASFEYSVDSDDYFFYVDERFIDLGGLDLGTVENINKPDYVQDNIIIEVIDVETSNSNIDRIVDFLRDNSWYVLGGIGILFAVLIPVFISNRRKKKSYKEKS